MNYELLYGIVACSFRLLGFPGCQTEGVFGGGRGARRRSEGIEQDRQVFSCSSPSPETP